METLKRQVAQPVDELGAGLHRPVGECQAADPCGAQGIDTKVNDITAGQAVSCSLQEVVGEAHTTRAEWEWQERMRVAAMMDAATTPGMPSTSIASTTSASSTTKRWTGARTHAPSAAVPGVGGRILKKNVSDTDHEPQRKNLSHSFEEVSIDKEGPDVHRMDLEMRVPDNWSMDEEMPPDGRREIDSERKERKKENVDMTNKFEELTKRIARGELAASTAPSGGEAAAQGQPQHVILGGWPPRSKEELIASEIDRFWEALSRLTRDKLVKPYAPGAYGSIAKMKAPQQMLDTCAFELQRFLTKWTREGCEGPT